MIIVISFILIIQTAVRQVLSFVNILKDDKQTIILSVNSTTNLYQLDVTFKRKCIQREYDRSQPLISGVLRDYGPEELLFQIEGLSLQAFLPHYDGCSKYSHDFPIYQAGVYRVNVILLRSNDTALNSVPIHPRLDYNVLYGDWLWLNRSLSTSTYCNMSNQVGVWIATSNNIQKAAGVFRDLEIAKAVKPRRFSNRCDHDGLIINTYVHVSRAVDSPSLNCASVIDQYHWVSDAINHLHCKTTTPHSSQSLHSTAHITPAEASKLFAHHTFGFAGDSHIRVFVNTLLLYACGLPMDNYEKDPPYRIPIVGKPCEGMIVRYYNHAMCDEINKDFHNYETIVFNCGHHDASGRHGSFLEYREHVEKLATQAMGGNFAFKQDRLFWLESTPVPVRRDKYVIKEKDWRTYYRLSAFNQLASPVYMSQGYTVIKSFDAMLPMIDRTCDEAHFTALENNMPMIQEFLTILRNKYSNNK